MSCGHAIAQHIYLSKEGKFVVIFLVVLMTLDMLTHQPRNDLGGVLESSDYVSMIRVVACRYFVTDTVNSTDGGSAVHKAEEIACNFR